MLKVLASKIAEHFSCKKTVCLKEETNRFLSHEKIVLKLKVLLIKNHSDVNNRLFEIHTTEVISIVTNAAKKRSNLLELNNRPGKIGRLAGQKGGGMSRYNR